MQACGNKAPIEIKNKAKWINLERQRWAEQFKIPILEGSPEPFPQLTVNPMRALCLVQKQHPAALSDCFGAMWQAFWVEGREIRKPEVVSFLPWQSRGGMSAMLTTFAVDSGASASPGRGEGEEDR